MNLFNKVILVSFSLLLYTASYAASMCPDLYPNGVQLHSKNINMVELCNPNYVVMYDTSKKANIFSSEKIQAVGESYPRSDGFRSDKRLTEHQRAENLDYLYSIYDKGHMAPAGDMHTLDEMQKSFLLSNATPQNKNLNRGIWRTLEQRIKENKTGTIYILTGAVYASNPLTIGNNKIPVPSMYYKCVFYSGQTECFKAANKSNQLLVETTLSETLEMVGVSQ